MARQIKARNLEPVIAAAQTWIEKCLIGNHSVFSPEELWTLENVEEVRSAYVDDPEPGSEDFFKRLRERMDSSSTAAKRLMAEMLWAIQLFPSNIGVTTKRRQIAEIWEMGGDSLQENQNLLFENVLVGIGSGGSGFIKHRGKEIVFILSLVDDLKKRSADERQVILKNYEDFTEWINHVPQEGKRQFRHMLRFFCFPDRVERMSSNSERWAVLVGFGKAHSKSVKKWSDPDLDEALLNLRHQMEAKHPGEILDFYESPLVEGWKSFDY
jgi:5-methylcytosine-specific restriction enzyme B